MTGRQGELPAMQPLDGPGLAVDFAFLLGLSFFLGFAFEDVFARAGIRRPGGVRSFPMLALLGGLLFLLDPQHLVAFALGLLIVGAWLVVYYSHHVNEQDESGQRNVGVMVVVLNAYAYVMGAVAIALPHWVIVGATVAATLLLTSRSALHALARGVDIGEIVTAAQFLVLAGLVLPLLPATRVTPLTSITPRQAWLALVVVSGLSYASYLFARYVAPKAGGLWVAAIGGLYSSTATTVVLARGMKDDPATAGTARAGITLATALMYVRVLVVVAVFNAALAAVLALPALALAVLAAALAAVQYRHEPAREASRAPGGIERNPLELGPAVAFAAAFVVISLLSGWVRARFGTGGTFTLAALVGVTDIDPFVLNLAQGGAAGSSDRVLAAAILIAASSNDVLKAVYAVAFGGLRAARSCVVALGCCALAGAGIAFALVAR